MRKGMPGHGETDGSKVRQPSSADVASPKTRCVRLSQRLSISMPRFSTFRGNHQGLINVPWKDR